MKTYNKIHFSQISEILMQAAMGVSAVCGYKYTISDLVYSLNELAHKTRKGAYYIAIREMGTECGYKEECVERCKGLGYPLVIAKIEQDKVCDYNMTIMFTRYWFNGDNNQMEREFDSL
jgi:hypothetical protein